MEKKDLRSLTIEEMTELAEHMGQKAFRGKQLFEWIHKKQVENLEEIARSRGCFQKGETLDLKKAAGILLDDFRSGRLGRMTLERP